MSTCPPAELPPPPPPAFACKFKPPPGAGGDISLCEMLLNNTEELKTEEDLPDDILNAPKSDIFKKIACPRCEKLIAEDDLENHLTSHSSEIFSFLYLGGQRNAHNKKELTTRTNITYIMNLALEVKNIFEECRIGCECTNGGMDCTRHSTDEELLRASKIFKYENFRINDKPGEPIYSIFTDAVKFIDSVREQDDRVLVHCVAGISRSASVVIAYTMNYKKWSLKLAYNYVKSKRNLISPISFFIEQLQLYEKHLVEDVGLVLDGYSDGPSLAIEDVYGSDTIFVGN